MLEVTVLLARAFELRVDILELVLEIFNLLSLLLRKLQLSLMQLGLLGLGVGIAVAESVLW